MTGPPAENARDYAAGDGLSAILSILLSARSLARNEEGMPDDFQSSVHLRRHHRDPERNHRPQPRPVA